MAVWIKRKPENIQNGVELQRNELVKMTVMKSRVMRRVRWADLFDGFIKACLKKERKMLQSHYP